MAIMKRTGAIPRLLDHSQSLLVLADPVSPISCGTYDIGRIRAVLSSHHPSIPHFDERGTTEWQQSMRQAAKRHNFGQKRAGNSVTRFLWTSRANVLEKIERHIVDKSHNKCAQDTQQMQSDPVAGSPQSNPFESAAE